LKDGDHGNQMNKSTRFRSALPQRMACNRTRPAPSTRFLIIMAVDSHLCHHTSLTKKADDFTRTIDRSESKKIKIKEENGHDVTFVTQKKSKAKKIIFPTLGT
jgi:hypothetical protein